MAEPGHDEHDAAEALTPGGPASPRAAALGALPEVDGVVVFTEQRLTKEIRALRQREQVSQPVFAHYLNVRKDAVSKWERGEKRPDGPSLKLLNLVRAKGLKAIA